MVPPFPLRKNSRVPPPKKNSMVPSLVSKLMGGFWPHYRKINTCVEYGVACMGDSLMWVWCSTIVSDLSIAKAGSWPSLKMYEIVPIP